MFVILNKKVIVAILSTLFATSRGYTDTAPLSAEEKIRDLDSSCTCSLSDLIGSDFSCSVPGVDDDYVYDIPNFGEIDSVCTVTAYGSVQGTWTFVSADATSAVYLGGNSNNYAFTLDPTQSVEGRCSFSSSNKVYNFGCWACPAPTSFPSFVPTDSPSPSVQSSENVNPTDDVGNNDNVNPTDDSGNDVNPTDDNENGGSGNTAENEECCDCNLFSLLQNLFLI